MIAMTRPMSSVDQSRLYVAFELSAKSWKLGMTSGFGVEPWVQTLRAGDLKKLSQVLRRGRVHFGLAADAPVVSCYEAGRDGFWIHRALTATGIDNQVIDSASIEVSRRARRAKTDRLDALKLVRMLVRYWAGEREVWRVVRVPHETDEAARHGSRERTALVKEHTRILNQIRGWLATCGAMVPRSRKATWWTRVETWCGATLPAPLQDRIARAETRRQLLTEQIAALNAQQRAAVVAAPADSARQRLVQLKGVAATSAATLLEEGLVWRAFQNRRQVGGIVGFTPTPHQSGDLARDRGISRAGIAPLQAISIQLAWNWIRWQPSSPLTQWFVQRFAHGGPRARRIGIVAVARRLLILLWRVATTGVVPAGTQLKPVWGV
jgi:transposase